MFVRPQIFSDPNHDFTLDELENILKKDDSQLDFEDYRNIFQGVLPAGTYEECVYFIKPLLNYINQQVQSEKDEKEGFCDLFDYFLLWCNEHEARLSGDGLLNDILDAICRWSELILNRFNIIGATSRKTVHIAFINTIFSIIECSCLYGFLQDQKIWIKNYFNNDAMTINYWIIDICNCAFSSECKEEILNLFSLNRKRVAVYEVWDDLMNTVEFNKNKLEYLKSVFTHNLIEKFVTGRDLKDIIQRG